ncbi:Basic helix-loop-helix (BHLH) DNA-binding superfamily [Rhynchospora pubera]|uniref:Basic helix-loop-helix (BHLH) DNA-binding superfamily n=1 Tax=Rhynchospora pubera TaxID=906938 RepID=A0AAV8C4Q3_9POAL|nr:Basic helix-loop-helix (BHLH) DNA-binding superfamily [Rhynchospora pubera]
MALEAIVFPQDYFPYTNNESFPFGKGSYNAYETPNYEMDSIVGDNNWDPLYSLLTNFEELDANSPSTPVVKKEKTIAQAAIGRRKRRRTKNVKNSEEIENQRMTHIAVERNRRRQMNEYLATLRSLMPPSYAQRGDQASIVGGAINYVKELEQQLQSLEVQKKMKHKNAEKNETVSPFAEFFTFPQYSSSMGGSSSYSDSGSSSSYNGASYSPNCRNATIVDSKPGLADVEVTMVDSHANLKVVARRRPRQLVKMVAGLQQLQLIPQHVNMTSADDMVMYSFSLKVEEESKLASVDEIATAVYEMLGRIQGEVNF